MNRALIAAAALLFALPVVAQSSVGSLAPTKFKDTSLFKPPAGAKVAIIEFEDLECSACAQASPIVHAAMDHYKIPRVHHDFLIPSHVWSRNAAIEARYLEDKVSPSVAEDQAGCICKSTEDCRPRRSAAVHTQMVPVTWPADAFRCRFFRALRRGGRGGL